MSPFWAVVIVLLVVVAAGLSVAVWALARDQRAREAARAQLLQQLAFPNALASPTPVVVAGAWDAEFQSEQETANDSMFSQLAVEPPPSRRWLAVAAMTALLAATRRRLLARESRQRAVRGAGSVAGHERGGPRIARPARARRASARGARLQCGRHRHPAESRRRNAVDECRGGRRPVRSLRQRAGDRAETDRSGLALTGASSTFAVAMPAVSRLARYRVEFRLAGGDALPHVDRRAAADQPGTK